MKILKGIGAVLAGLIMIVASSLVADSQTEAIEAMKAK